MYKCITSLLIILAMAACDSSNHGEPPPTRGSLVAQQQPATKQKSQIRVKFNDTSYDFIVYGRCTGGPHYNFWGIKPEFMHTTNQGPRIHLTGDSKQTVIKFYQDEQQRLHKVLTDDNAVLYQGRKMQISIDGENKIDIRVDCRQED